MNAHRIIDNHFGKYLPRYDYWKWYTANMVNWRKTRFGYIKETPIHIQLRRFRWMAFPIVLLLAALHQFTLFLISDAFPSMWEEWVQLMVYTLTGSIAIWLMITWISDASASQYSAEEDLRLAFEELEHNHQQLLALHNLGERITAANDQHAILEIAARAPLELTGASASSVITFDETENRLKLDMTWGLSESYLDAFRLKINNGIPSDRCQTCSALKTHIGSDCPLFQGLQSTAQTDGIQSLTCMPINHEEERIGIISAYFPTADGPSEGHIRLLNILGDVIATALENIRSRAREIETVHAIDRITNHGQIDESSAINDITRQVLEISAAGWEAQYGGIYLFQDEIKSWERKAQIGLKDSDSISALAQELAQRTYHLGEPIILSGIPPEESNGIGSMAAIPISTEGKYLGALFLGARRKRAVNENHAELLKTVAHQIALAIRNTQLYSQLGQMAVLKERYRLSREFHDGLAQTISYLGFQAEQVENLIGNDQKNKATAEIQELRENIRDAYADVREAIDGLRLSVENPGQIAERLAEYTLAFTRQTKILTRFSSNPKDLTIEASTALQILLIAQEALTNVRKHAQAKNVELLLLADQGPLQLVISDDGHGFPTKAGTSQPHHSYGLTTMRERAEGLGGTMSIATNPTQGTRITVSVPIKISEYD